MRIDLKFFEIDMDQGQDKPKASGTEEIMLLFALIREIWGKTKDVFLFSQFSPVFSRLSNVHCFLWLHPVHPYFQGLLGL